MIANIRPEAYAHLTPLILNVYTRFEEQQLVVRFFLSLSLSVHFPSHHHHHRHHHVNLIQSLSLSA